MKFIPKNLLQHLVALLLFAGIGVLFFFPQFSNRDIKQADIQAYSQNTQEIGKYSRKGDPVLWTNSLYGGMPTYQITFSESFPKIRKTSRYLALGLPFPAGIFIAFAVSFYVLLLILRIPPLMAMFGAICFSFLTDHIFLLRAGHHTKMATLLYLPFIFAGFYKIINKDYFIGFVLFVFGLALNIHSNHFQMSYYAGVGSLAFLANYLIKNERFKDTKHLMRMGLVFALGVAFSVFCSFGKIWTTFEYSKDTVRGEKILKTSGNKGSGLNFNQTMNWSAGVMDIGAGFIPGLVGGSSNARTERWTKSYDTFIKNGYKHKDIPSSPLYWGNMPSTDGPFYLGVGIVFFFLLGIFLKIPYRGGFLTAIVIIWIFALGKNIPVIGEMLYNYFPMYSKFRAHVSALSTANFFIVVFALLTLKELFSRNKLTEFKPKTKRTFYVLGGVSIFLFIFGPSLFDFVSPRDPELQSLGYCMNCVLEDRKSLFRLSSFRSLILVSLFFFTTMLYLNKKINASLAQVVLGLVMIFDIIHIDTKYIWHGKFEQPSEIRKATQIRDVDKRILEEQDPHFRVLDYTTETPYNSAFASKYHKSVGGYHAARLRRYDDVMRGYMMDLNDNSLNIINTKYVLRKSNVPGQINKISYNSNHYGNAWFVKKVSFVETDEKEYLEIGRVNLLDSVIVHKDFSDYFENVQFNKDGNITLVDYHPDNMIYSSNSTSDQMAVFSEVWYGPNKGWQAYIDDVPVEHIRVNYFLRGLKIPAGVHKIVFEFKPKSYYLGSKIASVSRYIWLSLILGYIGYLLIRFLQSKGVLKKKKMSLSKAKKV